MSVFLEGMLRRAKAEKKKIILAEGGDLRVIKAAAMATAQGIADIVVLGESEDINRMASEAGLDISGVQIISPRGADNFDELSDSLYNLRRHKGVTPEGARECLKNPLYYGAMAVKHSLADGMVAGAVYSTPDVLRPCLQILKTAPGTKLVSAFFVMDVPNCAYGQNGVFIYSDAGLNVNPNADELSEIALSSAKSFADLIGEAPRVAMLSYSTYGSAEGELVDKVRLATRLAKEKAPKLCLDGELQADAAIIEAIGRKKAPGSAVAGRANVLIFPDLNAGNIAYKLTERLAGGRAYGPITQGIAKPVNDLSRGCSAEDILGVIAITCVQAQNQGRQN